ncbi:MAG: aminotransferase class III-fold pyridoxal phosphate-dependent enzyme [Herbiconiux sp.]|nr:aminotransferase class III-fold pyridoxal phosphate-dependent enzyme [Herbiconiux sp.]
MSLSSARPSESYHLARPALTLESVPDLLQERYGRAVTVRELGSQQDRNFLCTASDGAFVLKVYNAAVSRDAVQDQIDAMARLAQAGLLVPTALPSVAGRTIETVEGPASAHLAVLLDYVEGESPFDTDFLSTDRVVQHGDLLGRVVVALAPMTLHGSAGSQWDLRAAVEVVRSLLVAVPADRAGRIEALTGRAQAHLGPVEATLPRQVIHGDLTDDNVLTRPRADGGQDYVGVIDIADLIESWHVGEPAIAMASMLHHELDGTVESLTRMLAAFHARSPLVRDELVALWPLVQLRCAVLAVSGAQQLLIDPDNAYAAERVEHEWRCFERAEAYGCDAMERTFAAALGLTDAADADNAANADNAATAPAPGVLLAIDTLDGRPARSISFAPQSRVFDGGRWQHPDAEETVLVAALADAREVVVVPQGEYRLSRAVPSAHPEREKTFSLHAELVAHRPFELVATDTVRVERRSGSALLLRTESGHGIVVDGITPHLSADLDSILTAGSGLGTALPRSADSALRSMRVTVVEPGATDDVPDFCGSELAPVYAALVRRTNVALGLDDGSAAPAPGPDRAASEQARREDILPSSLERYYDRPPLMVRGWRTWLIDDRAAVLLDLVNNVAGIGHAHPRLASAVESRLQLLNTNSRFLYPELADYSEALLDTARFGDYDTVLLVNSGTEAVDLALRMTQLATGRTQVVTHREDYHGWSLAADAVSTSAFDNPGAALTRPSWVTLLESPNPYRGRHRGPDAAAGYLEEADATLARLRSDGHAPAALIVESILGNSGGVVPPAGYLTGLQRLVTAAGGLTIADEVQVGFGRTGASFWAAEQEGFVPDVIVCAKAMGNGFPIGAVITRREIAEALSGDGQFFSTTGGSPAACAAGLAVLDVMREEDLQQNAHVVGGYLRTRLEELAGRHPIIGAVHGRGLYLGVELVTDRDARTPATDETARVCEALLRRGVVEQATSERQNVLKVKPPLTFSRDDADRYVSTLDDVLTKGWI